MLRRPPLLPQSPDSRLSSPSSARRSWFPATEWSVISHARADGETRISEGRSRLCTRYWKPLYLYLRRKGETHEDASDSVQGFFEFVLSSAFLSHVDREGGRFRSYLVKSLERWRIGQHRYEHAQKRGGQFERVPLEGLDEFGEMADLSVGDTPEMAFDRQWATDIVGRAFVSLRERYAKRGREAWFRALQNALPGGGALPAYSELAVALNVSEGAIKKGVHDLRTAFAAEMRQEIRTTVRDPADAEDELRYLITVMARG